MSAPSPTIPLGRMSRENTTGLPSAVRTRSTTSTSWPGSSPRRSASLADAGPDRIGDAEVLLQAVGDTCPLGHVRPGPPTPADKPLPLQGPKCLTQGGAGYAELGGELRFRGQTGPGRELAPADPLGQLALNRYRPQPRTLPWHLPLPVHVREYSSDNLGSSSGPHVARRVNLGHESGN